MLSQGMWRLMHIPWVPTFTCICIYIYIYLNNVHIFAETLNNIFQPTAAQEYRYCYSALGPASMYIQDCKLAKIRLYIFFAVWFEKFAQPQQITVIFPPHPTPPHLNQKVSTALCGTKHVLHVYTLSTISGLSSHTFDSDGCLRPCFCFGFHPSRSEHEYWAQFKHAAKAQERK